MNGDGFADVVVGAPGADAGGVDAGRVSVYLGRAGASFDAVADLTIDGMADEGLGGAVAIAGDLDGDGFADMVLGAPGSDLDRVNQGRVYVHRGAAVLDAVPDRILVGEHAEGFFGSAVAAAGDVDGDGLADVVVGAHRAQAEGQWVGRAYVHAGHAAQLVVTTPARRLTGTIPDGLLGVSVAGAGDVDGDGLADILVGAPGGARAYLVRGATDAALDARPDRVFAGPSQESRPDFGRAVALGDLDGDGFAEAIIGDDRAETGADGAGGRVFVYRGGPDGFALEADVTVDATPATSGLGAWLATIGDVNGDGRSELVAGGGGIGARLFLGGAPFEATADAILGTDRSGRPGAVAGGGDLNGDGAADVIVGFGDDGQTGDSAGAAQVFLGRLGSAFDTAADGTLLGGAARDFFGAAVALARAISAPAA